MHLIAFSLLNPQDLLLVLEVALGIGMVIFVHELGHFAVAKWCGVKCEKFYLGFDIGGWKLCKFRWGETEYGIGILPLGGYVKMLGQEDNPSRMAEEMERAKLQPSVAPALRDGDKDESLSENESPPRSVGA
ncbi:MAG TPA: site-2 protease family protein, partial [Pirellulales bacterium]|nr:site-2 protease family protein [Pirellulales bacterium]